MHSVSNAYESFYVDRAWHDLMRDVINTGTVRPDRTGAGTHALFGVQMKLTATRHGFFPAITTKKLFTAQMWAELECFIHGYSTLEEFHAAGCTIWDDNGNADYWKPKAPFEGSLGRIYGVQWRDWKSLQADGSSLAKPAEWETVKSTDQLQNLVDGLKKDPYGRRHMVTAWNPGELGNMCLPPCHVLFQCFAEPLAAGFDTLSMRVDMRSVDLFLGLPFDIASYATLLLLLAKEVGMAPGDLIFQLGDAHVYKNHMEQVLTVLGRQHLSPPSLVLKPESSLFGFRGTDASLIGYSPHAAVKAPMNV